MALDHIRRAKSSATQEFIAQNTSAALEDVKSSSKSIDMIGKVPLELVEIIFQATPFSEVVRCTAVSTKWYGAISSCDRLWRNIAIGSPGPQYMPITVLKRFLMCAKGELRILSLHTPPENIEECNLVVNAWCKKLRSLDLWSQQFQLLSFKHGHDQLVRFDENMSALSSTSNWLQELEEGEMPDLLDKKPYEVSICVRDEYLLNLESICRILKGSPLIEHLDLGVVSIDQNISELSGILLCLDTTRLRSLKMAVTGKQGTTFDFKEFCSRTLSLEQLCVCTLAHDSSSF